MMVEDPKRTPSDWSCFVWILVAFFYFYLSFDYLRVEMNDDRMADLCALCRAARRQRDSYAPGKFERCCS